MPSVSFAALRIWSASVKKLVAASKSSLDQAIIPSALKALARSPSLAPSVRATAPSSQLRPSEM